MSRSYDPSFQSTLNEILRRLKLVEVQPEINTLTPRRTDGSDALTTTSGSLVGLWSYDFQNTTPRVTVMVNVKMSAGSGSVDLFDNLASATVAGPFPVTNTGFALVTFVATTVSWNVSTLISSVSVRGSASGGTLSIQPVWAGNMP